MKRHNRKVPDFVASGTNRVNNECIHRIQLCDALRQLSERRNSDIKCGYRTGVAPPVCSSSLPGGRWSGRRRAYLMTAGGSARVPASRTRGDARNR